MRKDGDVMISILIKIVCALQRWFERILSGEWEEVTLETRLPKEYIITQKITIDDPVHTNLGFVVDEKKVTVRFPKISSASNVMDTVKEMLVSSFVNGEK
jgi:hypothetical protein